MSQDQKSGPVAPSERKPSFEALRQIAETAFALDRGAGVFESDDPDAEDMGVYFARLHGRVHAAFESWDAGLPASRIDFLGDEGAADAEPTGLPIDMAEILLDVLSAMRLMRADPAEAARIALRARKEAAEEDDEDDEDDEEDKKG